MDDEAKADRELEALDFATVGGVLVEPILEPPPFKRSILERVVAEFERDRSYRIEYREAI
jgi:hypothetical protein